MTVWMWFVAAFVFPAIWGNLMYLAVERLWPGPKTAAYDRKLERDSTPPPPNLPDYQI
jgi:hypothetical protein